MAIMIHVHVAAFIGAFISQHALIIEISIRFMDDSVSRALNNCMHVKGFQFMSNYNA